MKNIYAGSKNGFISHYCCLFSRASGINLLSHIVVLCIGIGVVRSYSNRGRFFILNTTLKEYNDSLSKALTLAAVVSIVVFIANELKEYNKRNEYISNFCSKLFGFKYKFDSIVKNVLFILSILLVIIDFFLLKAAENLEEYEKLNNLVFVIISISILLSFFIIEIIIYFIKLDYKKIKVEKSILGLTRKNFEINFISNREQIKALTDVIKLSEDINSAKNSILILLDIFSNYNYFNKIKIFDYLTQYIWEMLSEYCEDNKCTEYKTHVFFIINNFLEKDNSENNVLLTFFLFSNCFIYCKPSEFHLLSQRSKDMLFRLFPYITIIYSEKLNNLNDLKQFYKNLLIENNLELINKTDYRELYSLLQLVFDFKFSNNEIKSESYFIFKKLKDESLYQLYIYDYLIC